ncbi:tRNA pseudouridine(55) synthase TruB [Aliidiomarina shirensis]|uniref:tRNA pseudouridine synthase B n=1 Tax=Aliidiomarina shirensis TaxID=1048642 RepID=A0A432WY92_9GAMM|nr:tRNA pseudouridine(55) synthase TruB [Aliidiomarina shirensis]RUO38735.1 tRNA pseudouridine(55) synthase TruB [Aliidiomarina shirensis]
MARKTRGRAIDGVILVDKPIGESSNRILQQVKRVFYAQKAGHTGALDPLATGMLPVCLGESTKFAQFLLDADKAYRVVAEFGIRTNTSDADGEVVERKDVHVTAEQVQQALSQFRGDIKQVPSMFSALKHEGKPLYDYARRGITIEREARPITIYSLEVVSIDLPFVTLDVRCSKGTYIRSLVDDLGQVLGCGAYVKSLHRTAVGDYPSADMVPLADLQAMVSERDDPADFDYAALDALLLPVDAPVTQLPQMLVSHEDDYALLHGQPLNTPPEPVYENGELAIEPSLVRVRNKATGQFLGVAERRPNGEYWPKRVLTLPDAQ